MKIIAHRGSKLIWPENTMLAFDLAHEAGADGFETDLRLSGDGQIILCHDDNLARFGLADITCSALTVKQATQVAIPSIDRTHEDRIITLEELLRKYPDKHYIFDCKISDRELFVKLKALLEDLRFHDRIWFLTWSAEADAYVEAFFPGYAYFPRERQTFIWGMMSILGLGTGFEPDNSVLALPAYYHGMPVFKPAQVQSIQQRGMRFVGYLVNDRRAYLRCLACGVDTVLTDRPDLIAQFGVGESNS